MIVNKLLIGTNVKVSLNISNLASKSYHDILLVSKLWQKEF